MGSLGPWATATVFGISVSVSGLHGGGWVTLITAILGAIVLLEPGRTARLACVHRDRHAIWRAALWISAIVCILNLLSVENYRLAGIVKPGWGLYVTFIATLVPSRSGDGQVAASRSSSSCRSLRSQPVAHEACSGPLGI
jgi:hypothetical protein